MIHHSKLRNILFLDIETVSEFSNFDQMPDALQKHWVRKSTILSQASGPILDEVQNATNLYTKRAGIYAEFSKIVCISVGYLILDQQKIKTLKVKSFYHLQEKQLLIGFCDLLNKHFFSAEKHMICGHNIREFDIPFICRRLLINGLELPSILNISGKKPWQTKHFVDTLQLWKFGDYKNYTSLDLLAALFNVPSPKGQIDGSQVGDTYWIEDDLIKIVAYCERDVETVCKVYLKMNRIDLEEEMQIKSVTGIGEEE